MTRREQMTAAQRRYERTDKGKAARRKQNAKRISVLGERMTISDRELREYAIALRKGRKEAASGRTEI